MKPPIWIRVLFIAHGIATAAAAAALIIAPQAIPAQVGIALPREANLLSYLLGAAELAVAVLSIAAAWLVDDTPAVRLIAMVFVVMHAATALVEVMAIAEGASALLWANVALRLVVAALFAVVAFWRRTGKATERQR
jgi:hypothetical protein